MDSRKRAILVPAPATDPTVRKPSRPARIPTGTRAEIGAAAITPTTIPKRPETPSVSATAPKKPEVPDSTSGGRNPPRPRPEEPPAKSARPRQRPAASRRLPDITLLELSSDSSRSPSPKRRVPARLKVERKETPTHPPKPLQSRETTRTKENQRGVPPLAPLSPDPAPPKHRFAAGLAQFRIPKLSRVGTTNHPPKERGPPRPTTQKPPATATAKTDPQGPPPLRPLTPRPRPPGPPRTTPTETNPRTAKPPARHPPARPPPPVQSTSTGQAEAPRKPTEEQIADPDQLPAPFREAFLQLAGTPLRREAFVKLPQGMVRARRRTDGTWVLRFHGDKHYVRLPE